MIHFLCPACKATLSAPDDAAGAKLPCSKCGQRLQAPASPAKTVLGQLCPEPAPGGSDARLGRCPFCGGFLAVDRRIATGAVACPHCTKHIPLSSDVAPSILTPIGTPASCPPVAARPRERERALDHRPLSDTVG